MFKNMSIKRRMILTYLLSSLLFIALGLLSVRTVKTMSDSASMLYNHPLSVSNAALRASMYVKNIEFRMSKLYLAQNAFEIREEVEEIRRSEAELYKMLDIIQRDILGETGQDMERTTRRLVGDWKETRSKVIYLANQGKALEASRLANEFSSDQGRLLQTRLDELNAYARRKAGSIISSAESYMDASWQITVISTIVVVVLTCFVTVFLVRSIIGGISRLGRTMNRISSTGQLEFAELSGKNELTDLASGFNLLVERLGNQLWLRDGLGTLGIELSGGESLEQLNQNSIGFITRYVDGCAGAIYIYDQNTETCRLNGAFALGEGDLTEKEFKVGQGIVGQVARDRKPLLLRNVSSKNLWVSSGVVSQAPAAVYLVPLIYQDILLGVMEVAFINDFGTKEMEWMDLASETAAAAMYTATQRNRIVRLLAETQKANDELVAVNDELRAQGEELRVQASELKFNRDELERQRRRVEDADRLKSEFLSNMSHELRTPLNSIMALSQLILAQGLGGGHEKEIEYIKVIERNGRNLLNLINDILDISKIESGKVEFDYQKSQAASQASVVLETIAPLAREKGLTVEKHIDESLVIETDQEKLRQVLLNLMSNALKFTEKGKIGISIQEDGPNIVFKVSDTGIGISSNLFEDIFDEFRQVDGSTTRKFQGTGLGLSISRKLARLLGGDITVESKVGEGSVFSLILPKASHKQIPDPVPDENVMVQRELMETDARPVPPLLVIHGDDEERRRIEDFFIKLGFNIAGAENFEEGLDLAAQINLFAIIQDLSQSGLDSDSVIEKLRSIPQTQETPIVCLTPGPMIPLEEEKLIPKVFHVNVNGWQDRDEVFKKIENIVLELLGGKPVGRYKPLLLVVEDNEIAALQITSAVEDIGFEVMLASTGHEALELADQQKPDAVVLDLMMPGIGGVEVLEKLRAKPATAKAPVLVLTAKEITKAELARLKYNSIKQLIKKRDRGFSRVADSTQGIGLWH